MGGIEVLVLIAAMGAWYAFGRWEIRRHQKREYQQLVENITKGFAGLLVAYMKLGEAFADASKAIEAFGTVLMADQKKQHDAQGASHGRYW